jgi:hypothetical protein
LTTSPPARPGRVPLDDDDEVAVEVVDDGRADALGHARDLAERHGAARAVGGEHGERELAEVAGAGAGLGREAHLDVAHLAARVLPVAGVDAGERRAERLRDLPRRDAERAGDAAVELDVQLGLLPLGRQAHVDGARRGAHHRRHLLGGAGQRRLVGAAQLELHGLAAAAERVGEHRVGGARHARRLRADSRREVPRRSSLRSAFGDEPHVPRSPRRRRRRCRRRGSL